METRSDRAWNDTGQTGTGEPQDAQQGAPEGEDEGHGPMQAGTRGDLGGGGVTEPPDRWMGATEREPAGSLSAAATDTTVSGGTSAPETGDAGSTADAIVTGATTTSAQGAGVPNRSGHGGTGGSADGNAEEEGTTGQTMDEMLGGE